MSPLDDDQLRTALARRSRASLTEVERANILRAARLQALRPRRRLLPRFAGWLAAAVAAVVLVVIAVPVLLSSPVPVARASSSPVPTPSPIQVFSSSQLEQIVGDPRWVGRTILSDAAIEGHTGPGPICIVGQPCFDGVIAGTETEVWADVRDRLAGDGSPVEVDGQNRWIQQVALPAANTVAAYQVESNALVLLGPAQLGTDGNPLAVADVPRDSERAPTDNVYVVSGWWYSGFWPSCPVPEQATQTPQPELDYYCQGFGIFPTRPDNTAMAATIAGALELPAGLYPSWSDQHSPGAPVQGTFVVRSAGCQIVLVDNCPVWRLLGRLDDNPAPPAPPAPTAPSASLGSFKTADLLDRVSFEYPSDWNLNEINEFMHYGATLAFVSSPAAGATASCGPDYISGAGGSCANTYELPAGSMVVRVDSFSLPGHGEQTVAYDLANGWQPATVGGLPGALRDGYVDEGLPKVGHTRAWTVAAPGDDITSYTIIATDNGYPNAEDVVDRLLSSFTITSASSTPQPSVPPVRISNTTTLALSVAINGELKGTSEPGAIDLFDPSGLDEPWDVTVTTESGRMLVNLTYRLSDIGTNAGGTNPESGAFVGQRVDLSCGRLDVSVGGAILGPGVRPGQSFEPGDCDAGPSPSSSASTSPPVTQAAIYGAVGQWLMSSGLAGQVDINWVNSEAKQDVTLYDNPRASFQPSGPPLFGSTVSAEAFAALSDALPGITLVSDPTSVRADPTALECSALLGGAAILDLSAPRAVLGLENAFLVEVNVDHGCQGEIYDLEISAGQAGYSAELLQQSSWIV